MIITRESIQDPYARVNATWVKSLIPPEGIDHLELAGPPNVRHDILCNIQGLSTFLLKTHVRYCLDETLAFLKSRPETCNVIHAMADKAQEGVDPITAAVCASITSVTLSLDSEDFSAWHSVFRLAEVFRRLNGPLFDYNDKALEDICDRIEICHHPRYL